MVRPQKWRRGHLGDHAANGGLQGRGIGAGHHLDPLEDLVHHTAERRARGQVGDRERVEVCVDSLGSRRGRDEEFVRRSLHIR